MKYYFSKKINEKSFSKSIELVTEKLKEQGFGIVSEIDVKATLKKKIDVDFKNYTILGACHPEYAYHALSKEDKIGVFLPCNVVVEENEGGEIEVSAVDPIASMSAVENSELESFALTVQTKLKQFIAELD